jgi:hypothetical protein
VTGEALGSFVGHYIPALVVGVVCRFVKPAWGWTPLWIGVILTVALSFLRKL